MRLYARPETTYRLTVDSSPKMLLVGGFSGYLNFGDLVQLQGAIRWHRRLEPEIAIFPLIHTRTVRTPEEVKSLERAFDIEDWLYYAETGKGWVRRRADSLGLQAIQTGGVRGGLALHVYGGGFFNRFWGGGKIRLLGLVHRCFNVSRFLVSGQQVGPEFCGPLARFLSQCPPDIVGCRDPESVQLLKAAGLQASLSGDDSLDELEEVCQRAGLEGPEVGGSGSFGLHVNLSPYVYTSEGGSDAQSERESFLGTVRDELSWLHRRFGIASRPLVISASLSQDRGVPEGWSSLGEIGFGAYFPRFEGVDLAGAFMRRQLPEAVESLKTRDILISHSYHVALLGMMAGAPAYLFAHNDYYRQKRRGFGVPDQSLHDFMESDVDQILEQQRGNLDRQFARRREWLNQLEGVMAEDPGRRRAPVRGARPDVEAQEDEQSSEPRSFGAPADDSIPVDSPSAEAHEPSLNPQARLETLQAELNRVWASRSWRWTAPVRAIYGWTSRLLDRIAPSPGSGIAGRYPPPAYIDAIEAYEPGKLLVLHDAETRQSPGRRWDPTRPLVSVVVPCFNHGEYLEESVDSVLAQTFQDFEIIVVNDGSTDPGTIEVLRSLSRPKTRVIHQPNRGLPAARNRGIGEARGRYVCCLDADDTLEPTYLEKAVWMLETKPDVGFVYTWVRRFGEETGTWYTDSFSLSNLLQYNHISVAAVFRRVAWERVGGFWEAMRPGLEDWEFWIHLAAAGFPGERIPEPLLNHRKHGPSMLDEAVEEWEALVQRIQSRHAALYARPALVRAIQRGYGQGQADRPDLNVGRPEQYRPLGGRSSRTGVIVGRPISEPDQESMAKALRSFGSGRLEDAHVVTTLSGENAKTALPASFGAASFHLPDFLPEYAWGAYLSVFLRSRAIERLLIYRSSAAHAWLPQVREVRPDAIVAEFLPSDASPSYAKEAARAAGNIDVLFVSDQELRSQLEQADVEAEKILILPRSGAGLTPDGSQ